jgi:1,4-alpha-glucan branching enzyme
MATQDSSTLQRSTKNRKAEKLDRKAAATSATTPSVAEAAEPAPDAPMGATLRNGGAAFRTWAPCALRVSVRGSFSDWDEMPLLREDGGQFWSLFVAGVQAGDEYKFYIKGPGSEGWKRDSYARALTPTPNVPPENWNCIVSEADKFPWHDAGFVPPAFNDLVIYQLHLGAFFDGGQPGVDRRDQRPCRFLDVLHKINYFVELGVNAIQPLPVVEFPPSYSLGYNGTDYFSPEMAYFVPPTDPDFAGYVKTANDLLLARGKATYSADDLATQPAQLKALVDICHVYGLAVLFDVVYNHAGGPFDDQSLYFFDRQHPGTPFDNNRSLYFTDRGWAGGLVFAFWNQDVRQFLINNGRFNYDEYHIDGYRYDEVTVITDQGGPSGYQFCQNLTDTLHYHKPAAVQIAEYWAFGKNQIVRPTGAGGGGFDAVWYDGLRDVLRRTIAAASGGAKVSLNLDPLRDQLEPKLYSAWRSVQHLENHDLLWINLGGGPQPRVARLADPSNARSWYARSRARVANGLLITAPGIPMLFMGQEFLEDKPWTDAGQFHPGLGIYWDGLTSDRVMQDFLRSMQDLIWLRRKHPALRGEGVHAYYNHNHNRVLAVQRWVEGVGRDVVIVASLNESTFWSYDLGFPQAGQWLEIYNSDTYDNFPNPIVAGNRGSVWAAATPRDGLPASAIITIPANGLLVFARDRGD